MHKNLPHQPGCYLFKAKNSRVLYVGKAKDLKKRVESYFKNKDIDAKTELLLDNHHTIDFIVTDNEIEALILENNLIKKYQPKYNILLKDSKRYAYLEITDEDFPRLMLARKRKLKGEFFGPFISAQTRDYVRKTVIKAFKLRTCKRFPKRPCIRYHIGHCKAPCANLVSKQEYDEDIKSSRMVLAGKSNKLKKRLEEKMKIYSEQQQFEQALEVRDQIQAIEWLSEKQLMERQRRYDEDVINYHIKDAEVNLMLFNVYKGILENKQEFSFDWREDFLEEFISRYYADNPVPKEIILPRKISPSLKSYLEKIRGNKVRIRVPKKGEKKNLLELVSKNIIISFYGEFEKIDDLKKKLKLNFTPKVIECFDISHISGTSTAGSMVQFRNGKPDKSNYRRFRIRSVEGPDDTKAIHEVVTRRYRRLKSENAEFPDLVIIDGGKGQLNAALQAVDELNISIPIISIAKQFEEIYVPGRKTPIRLSKRDKALQYIQEMRDEAHRFAIKYNRLLRQKKMKE